MLKLIINKDGVWEDKEVAALSDDNLIGNVKCYEGVILDILS